MFDTSTLVPIAFLLSVAFTLVAMTKVISDGRTRRRLIENRAAPDLVRAVVTPATEDLGLYSALKWGILTGAVGVALIVVQFLPYRPDQPIVLGVILVFAAAGLIAYYLSARRLAGPTQRGSAV